MWRDEVLSVAATRNIDVDFMPGGVFIIDKFPSAIKKLFNFSIVTLGVHLTHYLPNTTIDWYGEFINRIIEKGEEPNNVIDIANLHFYPFIYSEAGTLSLQPILDNLSEISNYVSSHSRTKDVWITEIGNLNPLEEFDIVDNLMKPMFEYLDEDNIPNIKRWYWYKDKGGEELFKKVDDVQVQVSTLLTLLYAAPILEVLLCEELGDFISFISEIWLEDHGWVLGELAQITCMLATPTFRWDVPFETNETEQLNNLVQAIQSRGILTGLTEEDTGTLTGIGAYYYQLAGMNFIVPTIITPLLLN